MPTAIRTAYRPAWVRPQRAHVSAVGPGVARLIVLCLSCPGCDTRVTAARTSQRRCDGSIRQCRWDSAPPTGAASVSPDPGEPAAPTASSLHSAPVHVRLQASFRVRDTTSSGHPHFSRGFYPHSEVSGTQETSSVLPGEAVTGQTPPDVGPSLNAEPRVWPLAAGGGSPATAGGGTAPSQLGRAIHFGKAKVTRKTGY